MTASANPSNASSLILACNIHNADFEMGCIFPCVVSLQRRMQRDLPPGWLPWSAICKDHLTYISLLNNVTLFDILFDSIPKNCTVKL